MLRDRVPAARVPVLRAVERVVPLPADLAPVPLAFVPELAEPALRFAAEAERALADLALFGLAVDLARVVPDFARDPVAFAAPLELRDELDEELAEELSSPPHLPDITRCAASATASAMMLPSLVALETMLVAACDAVSAASSPASRILRRALGLALIAAAAAARPAASISLLIAALAILSMVSLPDDEPDEPVPEERVPDELFLEDFAIVNSSL